MRHGGMASRAMTPHPPVAPSTRVLAIAAPSCFAAAPGVLLTASGALGPWLLLLGGLGATLLVVGGYWFLTGRGIVRAGGLAVMVVALAVTVALFTERKALTTALVVVALVVVALVVVSLVVAGGAAARAALRRPTLRWMPETVGDVTGP